MFWEFASLRRDTAGASASANTIARSKRARGRARIQTKTGIAIPNPIAAAPITTGGHGIDLDGDEPRDDDREEIPEARILRRALLASFNRNNLFLRDCPAEPSKPDPIGANLMPVIHGR